MYITITITKPGRTRATSRFYLARRAPNGVYVVIAEFNTQEECSNVAELLNHELLNHELQTQGHQN